MFWCSLGLQEAAPNSSSSSSVDEGVLQQLELGGQTPRCISCVPPAAAAATASAAAATAAAAPQPVLLVDSVEGELLVSISCLGLALLQQLRLLLLLQI